MPIAELPFVDEHVVDIAASAPNVWSAVLETLDRTFSGATSARYSRLVGCVPSTSSGPRPLAEGSTVPGFRIFAALSPTELALEGRHHFSDYALIIRLEDLGSGRTRLRAETRASFAGVTGGIYRMLVISSGGHVVGMRRLLSGIKRRGESVS